MQDKTLDVHIFLKSILKHWSIEKQLLFENTFSNSPIQMLYIRHPSDPCGDTGHFGHYKNNWTEAWRWHSW